MSKVCAIGELLIDFTPVGKSKRGNNIYEQNLGGGPANVAVATAMLGVSTSFIGKVGNDSFGITLKQDLIKKNVNTKGLAFTKKVNTTLAFVHLDKNNDRSFSFYRNPGADIMLSEKDVDYSIIDKCELLHFSSVSLTNNPSRATTIKAVKYAKKKGKIISYDPNLRELLWSDLKQAKQIIYKMIKYADIIKLSQEELIFLTDEKNITKAIKRIKKIGVKLIFVTLGDKGSIYSYKKLTNSHKTYNVKVVDTTGCGDSFIGAIIYKVLQRKNKLKNISKDQLDDMNIFANMVGSLAAMKKGGAPSMPTLKEVEEFGKRAKIL